MTRKKIWKWLLLCILFLVIGSWFIRVPLFPENLEIIAVGVRLYISDVRDGEIVTEDKQEVLDMGSEKYQKLQELLMSSTYYPYRPYFSRDTSLCHRIEITFVTSGEEKHLMVISASGFIFNGQPRYLDLSGNKGKAYLVEEIEKIMLWK